MARLFNDAANQYLHYNGGIVVAEGLTMACWYYSDDATANQTLIALGNDGNLGFWRLALRGAAAGDFVIAQKQRDAAPSLTPTAISPGGYTVNTWEHAAAVFWNDTSRYCYLNGSAGAENIEICVDPTPDFSDVGALRRNAVVQYMSGRIAEAAIWDAALSDAEIMALAQGMSPFRIKGDNLISYWPVFGAYSPEPDYGGGTFNMTLVNGPTVADHVPLGPPFGYDLETAGIWGVAAPAVSIPVLMYDYHRRRID